MNAAEERDRDRHLRAVQGGADDGYLGVEEGEGYDPLIDDGEYLVGFVSEDRTTLYRSEKWVCRFQVLSEGEGKGAILRYFVPIPPKLVVKGRDGEIKGYKIRRPRAAWIMSQAFAVATGRRPPPDLARRRPSNYLGGCTFRALVRAGLKDSKNAKRAREASYSKVIALLERIDGTPACLRSRQ